MRGLFQQVGVKSHYAFFLASVGIALASLACLAECALVLGYWLLSGIPGLFLLYNFPGTNIPMGVTCATVYS